jgi:VWFA-related protein
VHRYPPSLVPFVAVLLILATTAAPQSKGKEDATNTSAEHPYLIRAVTHLVQVSVVVQGSNGNPVTGLKKEDFTVLDKGRPQDIAFFFASTPTSTIPRPLPANVFTNRNELKGQDPGATIVILYDQLNTAFLDQAYARQHILRFLKSVKPQDRVAIFALSTHLLALHDFTQDAASLHSSVERFSPRLLAAFDASHPDNFHVPALANDPSWRAFENHVNNANGEIADAYVVDRIEMTSSALLSIADYVKDIPGHKSLVWVSSGIPIQIGSDRIGVPDRDRFLFADDMTGLAQTLSRVDMAIYPIDAGGIDADDSASAFFMRGDQRDSFRLIADSTGGKAFYGTNDIAGAINSAVEDSRYIYTLGFYPNHGDWDGKFREIKISLRNPGPRLRYRRGYFAFPDRSDGAAIMKTDLAEAARSPLDATELGVTVRTRVLSPTSARLLQLQIALDPKQLLLHQENNRRQGGLDLLFVQIDSIGKFLAAEKQHLDVDFDRKEYDSLAKTGMVLQRRLGINPGSTEIRIFVRDAASGLLGSVTIPVKTFSF